MGNNALFCACFAVVGVAAIIAANSPTPEFQLSLAGIKEPVGLSNWELVIEEHSFSVFKQLARWLQWLRPASGQLSVGVVLHAVQIR